MKKITLLFTLGLHLGLIAQINLEITEIFPGQTGTDLTADWFEIHNTGTTAWVSGVDEDLFYDDDSADGTTADQIFGITDIQPNERVIILVTDNTANETTAFTAVWGAVVDLTSIEVGYTDGSGLGGGGDAVTLWLGDPNTTTPMTSGSYPDTAANDGQSYDLELNGFSTVGNANFAVITSDLGGNSNDVPNIGSPGNVDNSEINLVITEIFSGQVGADLTEDWFEIYNAGAVAWVSGVDEALFYDDDSADATTADQIFGITDLQPGERAIVLITDNTGNGVNTFSTIWSPVVDLTDIEIGYADGAGLGGAGDTVNIWLGDPQLSMPIAIASYPDTASNDGQTYDLELNTFSTVGNTSNAVQTIAQGGSTGTVSNIGSPGNVLTINPEVNFSNTFYSINENASNITVDISISEAPTSDVSVEVVLNSGSTAAEGTDFSFASTQVVTFLSGSTTNQSITIPIEDNNIDNSDVFFVLQLQNETGVNIGVNNLTSVYILDDDTVVPTENTSTLSASYLNSYTVDSSGTAEITAYDATSQRLFVTNDDTIEVLDFSDPNNISSITSISLPSNTSGVQSVAFSNGVLAAAIAADPVTDAGFVMFSDIDGSNAVMVTVGALPDMITFTPDGTKLLVANEGEPSSDYTIDPEGSISMINVTGGLSGIDQSDVTTLDFNAFDSQLSALLASGVRIFGPNATVSQDLEPEYITVSNDSETAYVALQENNAYAVVDIVNNTITSVLPFGLKDHSMASNSLDTSDETDFIFNASWPIYGMYMPDAISFFEINGVPYIATANEGDARDYNAYAEERKLGDSDYVLDAAVFGNTSILELRENLGDINISIASGNTDADPEFEEIHVYGGRSFSIFEANSANIVYDSGNDFEIITAAHPTYGTIFNVSNSNNNFKNRSDNKGPEPEGIIVEEINGSYYAFIILERVGGVMIYDVSNPTTPVFLQYLNNRGTVEGDPESGDLGPEGIVYINPEDSPTDTGLIVISNEVSATLSVYSLDNVLSVDDVDTPPNRTFSMYPNPAESLLNFNRIDNYNFYDLSGRLVKTITSQKVVEISDLESGIYLVGNSLGQSKKLIVD